MNIGFVGCGYVAEFYAKTLPNYPTLSLVGAYDRNTLNLDRFLTSCPVRRYVSIDEMAADSTIELIVNLTNPRDHFELTRRCLEAGKHVYSEKPLGMTVEEATALVELARSKGLYLASAPCSVLSETAQTWWKALRERVVGQVRLVYANFDDGMIAPRMSPWAWVNESGVPWPAKDEFEVGCTYEHAGYVLTWLAACFGPALNVTSFASCQIQDKGIPVASMAPDFTVGCVEYANGVVARVTCGLVGPRDKSLTVVGDDGVLFVGNVRDDAGPVIVRPSKLRRWQGGVVRRTQWFHRWLEGHVAWPGGEAMFGHRYPLVRKPRGRMVGPGKPVDFMRGPAELVEAIGEKRPCRLSAEFCAHIVEITEALQYPERFGGRKRMTTTFAPMQPLPWEV
jgi:predicted dehydrogenase